jgi:hypothetical protein
MRSPPLRRYCNFSVKNFSRIICAHKRGWALFAPVPNEQTVLLTWMDQNFTSNHCRALAGLPLLPQKAFKIKSPS